jgi:hypothetical protein
MERILMSLSSNRARKVRSYIAFWSFILTPIAWPLSAFTWAKHEPQFVLGLSWLAIMYTAWDVLTTSQVYEENDES